MEWECQHAFVELMTEWSQLFREKDLTLTLTLTLTPTATLTLALIGRTWKRAGANAFYENCAPRGGWVAGIREFPGRAKPW